MDNLPPKILVGSTLACRSGFMPDTMGVAVGDKPRPTIDSMGLATT